MNVVVPDVSLWGYLGGIRQLLGAELAVVLVACVAGLVVCAVLWAGGHAFDAAGVASTGKVGVCVSIVGAFCATALPSLMKWVIVAFMPG